MYGNFQRSHTFLRNPEATVHNGVGASCRITTRCWLPITLPISRICSRSMGTSKSSQALKESPRCYRPGIAASNNRVRKERRLSNTGNEGLLECFSGHSRIDDSALHRLLYFRIKNIFSFPMFLLREVDISTDNPGFATVYTAPSRPSLT